MFLCGGSQKGSEVTDGDYVQMVDDVQPFNDTEKNEEDPNHFDQDISVTCVFLLYECNSARHIFNQKYEKLGKMKFAEYVIILCWLVAIFLWIFRADLSFTGICNPWHGYGLKKEVLLIPSDVFLDGIESSLIDWASMVMN